FDPYLREHTRPETQPRTRRIGSSVGVHDGAAQLSMDHQAKGSYKIFVAGDRGVWWRQSTEPTMIILYVSCGTDLAVVAAGGDAHRRCLCSCACCKGRESGAGGW